MFFRKRDEKTVEASPDWEAQQVLAQIPLADGSADADEKTDEEKRPSVGKFVLKLVGFAAVAALLAAGGREAATRPFFALTHLEMTGGEGKVQLSLLKEALEGVLTGSYFTVNLDEARRAAETVPWVRSAVVRRVWPNGLAVEVTVHHAMAVYEDGRLVNAEGELFSANPEEAGGKELPSFYGPTDRISEISLRYQAFSEIAKSIPAEITDVIYSDRGSWSVVMEGPRTPPTKVELGFDLCERGGKSGAEYANGSASEERELLGEGSAGMSGSLIVEKKFKEIAEAYPLVEKLLNGPPSSIDARYRKAFAAGAADKKAYQRYLEKRAVKEAARKADLPAPPIALEPESDDDDDAAGAENANGSADAADDKRTEGAQGAAVPADAARNAG